MRPVLLSLGPVSIYSWGFLLALGTLLGGWGAVSLARRSGWEQPEDLLDVGVGAVLAGVLGSRLNYLLLYKPQEFLRRPGIFFQFSDGGLVFYGGLLAGIVAGGWLARRRNLRFWDTGDILVPFLAAGYGLVRIGCFLNGCCYGRVSQVPWAVVMPQLGDNLPRHPVQLYAAVMGMLLGWLLFRLYQRRLFSGAVFLIGIAGGAVERFIEDFFRDTLMYTSTLTVAQVVSAGLFLVALILYFWRKEYLIKQQLKEGKLSNDPTRN
ncbi:MAG TPA: prolipoprotein diacylglyceryl transferase [Firmicutes bacterium]|nr:prolipoprotein diacylglyceryl transferase [Bacillota bacterium]